MGLQSQFDWPMVNNFPLQILCETGLLGFLIFAGITLSLVRAVLVRIRQQSAPQLVAFAAALAVFGVWTQLFSFSQFNLPHLWVAVGLLLAALRDETLSLTNG